MNFRKISSFFIYYGDSGCKSYLCIIIGMDVEDGGIVLTDILFPHLLEWNGIFN
jgi:hypothetical protein